MHCAAIWRQLIWRKLVTLSCLCSHKYFLVLIGVWSGNYTRSLLVKRVLIVDYLCLSLRHFGNWNLVESKQGSIVGLWHSVWFLYVSDQILEGIPLTHLAECTFKAAKNGDKVRFWYLTLFWFSEWLRASSVACCRHAHESFVYLAYLKNSINNMIDKMFKPVIRFSFCQALLINCGKLQVRANAVRALGNLARFVNFSSNHFSPGCKLEQKSDSEGLHCSGNIQTPASEWLGTMVQTFMSCVTTGNVKVSLKYFSSKTIIATSNRC